MLRRIAKIIQFLSEESYLLDAILSLTELPAGMVDTFLNLFGNNETLKKGILRALEKESLKGSKQSLLRENNMAVEVIIRFTIINSTIFFQTILKEVIQEILEDEEFRDVEVNPIFTEKSIRTSVIKQRQKVLVHYANKIFDTLTSNGSKLPRCLGFVFGNLKNFLSDQYEEEAVQLCGSLFFLRVLNPIMLSPENYGVVSECPAEYRRGLILLTKIVQAAANGVQFDEAKEEYMVPFNEFISSTTTRLPTFYEELMTVPEEAEDWYKMQMAEPEKRGFDFLLFLRKNLPTIEKNIQLGHLASRKKNFQKLKSKIENEIDNRQLDYGSWGTDQVTFWLNEELHLPEYSDIFREEGVDGSVLVELTEQDLILLGIKALGHRKKIIRALELLRETKGLK